MKLRVDINLDNLGPDVGQEIARLLRLVTEIYKSYTAEEMAGAQGVRGEGASRLGNSKSGLVAHVNGWEGGISVHAENSNAPEPGADRFLVYVTGGSNQGIGDILVGELLVLESGRRLVWRGDNYVVVEGGRIECIGRVGGAKGGDGGED